MEHAKPIGSVAFPAANRFPLRLEMLHATFGEKTPARRISFARRAR
jgi:hypothetical protein